jgi:hypothetical protein
VFGYKKDERFKVPSQNLSEWPKKNHEKLESEQAVLGWDLNKPLLKVAKALQLHQLVCPTVTEYFICQVHNST